MPKPLKQEGCFDVALLTEAGSTERLHETGWGRPEITSL
jgi:hypothetical protein